MKRTIISIIVPVYHSGEYLKDCLHSLENQDFELPYQVIMVDCGGDASVTETAKEQERKNYRFYYFRTERNLGPGFSRNFGLFLSSGQYVTFVDGDDVVTSDYLSRLYRIAEKTRAEVVTCGYFLLEGKKKRKGYSRSNRTLTGEKVLKKIYHSPFLKYRTFCWGRLYQKDFLMEHRIIFDADLFMFEDWQFINHVLLYAKKVSFLKKCLYGYRQRKGSIMSVSSDRFRYHLLAMKKSKEIIEKENPALAEDVFDRLRSPLRVQLKYDLSKEQKKEGKTWSKEAEKLFGKDRKNESV